jgi:hypothetical protein
MSNDHVRLVELGSGFHFPIEPLNGVSILCHRRLQIFQGDEPLRYSVLGLENLHHTASPDFVDQDIIARYERLGLSPPYDRPGCNGKVIHASSAPVVHRSLRVSVDTSLPSLLLLVLFRRIDPLRRHSNTPHVVQERANAAIDRAAWYHFLSESGTVSIRY